MLKLSVTFICVLWFCGSVFPVEAARPLSSPVSVTAEIDLGRIPNRSTQIYLRIRNAAWRDVFLEKSGNQPVSPKTTQILEKILGHLQERSGVLLSSCFYPGVQEFILARWPSQWSMGIEQQVWMIGYRMESPELVEPFQSHLILSCFPFERLPIERKLDGFPVKTLSTTSGRVHILRGKNHILVSSSIQLLKDFLASLAHPPDPPKTLPDAQIGFNLASLISSEPEKGSSLGRDFMQQLGVDRLELSLIQLPVGLEVRVALKGSHTLNTNRFLFQRATNLLDSIPAQPDLAFVASGLNFSGRAGSLTTDFPMDQPVAIGIDIPDSENPPPKAWWVRGAVANSMVLSQTAAAQLRSVSGIQPIKPPQGWMVKTDRERIEFGTHLKGPTLSTSNPLREHFRKISEEALAAGLLSPRLLALPVYWDSLLGNDQPAQEKSMFSPSWEKAVAPLEFSVATVSDGLELRLISPSPLSHLLFYADLLFLLQMDYTGDWDRLFQIWEQQSKPESMQR